MIGIGWSRPQVLVFDHLAKSGVEDYGPVFPPGLDAWKTRVPADRKRPSFPLLGAEEPLPIVQKGILEMVEEHGDHSIEGVSLRFVEFVNVPHTDSENLRCPLVFDQELQVGVECIVDRVIGGGLDGLGVLANLSCEIAERDDHAERADDFADISERVECHRGLLGKIERKVFPKWGKYCRCKVYLPEDVLQMGVDDLGQVAVGTTMPHLLCHSPSATACTRDAESSGP